MLRLYFGLVTIATIPDTITLEQLYSNTFSRLIILDKELILEE